MAELETRARRIKVFTLKPVYFDPDKEDLGGEAIKVKAGNVCLMSNLQYEHYRRHKCVTKDLPLEEEQ